jgi:prephenate dehydratase
MAQRISIQGYEGCFHQVAAKRFFGEEVEVIPCSNFRDVIAIAEDKQQSDGGIMAIENSIAGSILPNYGLIQRSKLRIVGEVYLPIQQHLMVNHGVALEDIKEVHSHPMAILQCLDYLEPFNWKLVETEDTALSAKHLHQRKSKHIAAIASSLAADLYGLNIIAPDIHTMKDNDTRFLVLKREAEVEDHQQGNKASVHFRIGHERGTLAKALTMIADGGVNLSKLQSFPVPGSRWQYHFHADMEFDAMEQFGYVIKQLKQATTGLKVYGIYNKGISR